MAASVTLRSDRWRVHRLALTVASNGESTVGKGAPLAIVSSAAIACSGSTRRYQSRKWV